jgi:hypothetical protein
LEDSTDEDVAVKLLLSRCGAIPLTVCLLIILQILGKKIECADEGADVLTLSGPCSPRPDQSRCFQSRDIKDAIIA